MNKPIRVLVVEDSENDKLLKKGERTYSFTKTEEGQKQALANCGIVYGGRPAKLGESSHGTWSFHSYEETFRQ